MDVVKRPIREVLRAQRAAQDAALLACRDAELTAAILASPQWYHAPVVAAFVGVHGEPDTTALLDAGWAAGKAVWLPRLYGDTLQFVATTDRSQLVATQRGTYEPTLGRSPPKVLADLAPAIVLLPGLGFGRDGARIGDGRGYYDRALAPLRDRTDVWRLGLCHALFLDPPQGPIPMAVYDVPVHAVATEYGIIPCATWRR